MKVEKKDLEKSQVEILVELSLEEFKPFIEKGVIEVSKEIKIEGFRPGKAPYERIKQKVGEMGILEQAARMAINKNIEKIVEDNLKDQQPVGNPQIDITKLAPENPLEFKIVVAILPSIVLGEYKSLKIKEQKLEIDEKEVDKAIKTIAESRGKEVLADRAIKEGDKVTASVQMFLDKVPIEGGQSNDAAILIGKDYFVPGFDKKLIGAKKGDVREFELPYPRDFHQKNLAGKMVEFKVTVKDVFDREIPEVNDEFAKTLGLKSLEDLKKEILKNIETEKRFETDKKNELNIINKVLEKTKIGELPEILVNNEAEKMMTELEGSITQQGGKFEEYLSSIKKTRNQVVLDMLPDAVKRVKSALLIREIARLEKVEVKKEEVAKKQEALLKQYKGYAKVAERVKDPNYKLYLANMLSNQKVMEKLKEWNLEK